MPSAAPVSEIGRTSTTARVVTARTRVLVAIAAAALGGLIVALIGPWWLVPLSAWDCGAIVFVVWIWASLRHLDGAGTMTDATREDASRAGADLVLLCASVVSLIAVGLVLVRASKEAGLAKDLLVGMTVISVVLAWSMVHTIFTLRYARLYYKQGSGGVDFNERDEQPSYADFLYLALTIGMTFQVSDTDLTTKPIRHMAIRHALLSYMFGVVIIAASINLMAGLLTK
jgi:uncharacterized membrane protein